MEMDNHVRELTSIVRAIADQINFTSSSTQRINPNNREEIPHYVVNCDTLCGSDMATGASSSHQTNPSRLPPIRYPKLFIHNIDDNGSKIYHLRETMIDNVS